MKIFFTLFILFSFLFSNDFENENFKSDFSTNEENLKNILTNNYNLIDFKYNDEIYQKNLDIYINEAFTYYHKKDYLKSYVLLKHIEKYYKNLHTTNYDRVVRIIDSLERIIETKSDETTYSIFLDKKLLEKSYINKDKKIVNTIVFYGDMKGVMYNFKQPITKNEKLTFDYPFLFKNNIFSITYIEENLAKEIGFFRKNNETTQLATINKQNKRIPIFLDENIELWLENSSIKYFDKNKNVVKDIIKNNSKVKQITYYDNNNIKNIDFFNDFGKIIKTTLYKNNKINTDLYFNDNFEIEKRDFYENDVIGKTKLFKNEVLFVESILDIKTNTFDETYFNSDGSLRNGEFERKNETNIFIFNLINGKKEKTVKIFDNKKNYIKSEILK